MFGMVGTREASSLQRFCIFASAATVAGLSGFAPAVGAVVSVKGDVALVAGKIIAGDQFKFRDAVVASGGRVKIVTFDSPGGNILSAGELGRMIRSGGYTTLVDAARQTCASACTLMFAAGVERIYLHAPSTGGAVATKGFRGLGFHQGSRPGELGGPRYSGVGTGLMIDFYYEFGVPKAASLADAASPTAIFALTGAQALETGFATRLDAKK